MGQLTRIKVADAIMPYQIKAGSLTIVATNLAEALKIFSSLTSYADEPVFIRDMDGIEIDPVRLQSMTEPES